MFSITKTPSALPPGNNTPLLLSQCEIVMESIDDNLQLDSMLNFPIATKTQVIFGKIYGYLGLVIDKSLEKMTAGEKSEFRVDFSTVDPGKPTQITFSLELICFSPGKEIYELSFAECFDLSQHWKSSGNTWFKSSDVCMAGLWYRKSLKILLACCTMEKTDKEYQLLLCQCHLNLAAVQLKRKLFSNAVKNCSEALVIDPKMLKALYRRAIANKSLGKLEDSIKDLKLALKFHPNSSSVQSLLKDVMGLLMKD